MRYTPTGKNSSAAVRAGTKGTGIAVPQRAATGDGFSRRGTLLKSLGLDTP
jgi:hypothetical protein